MKKDLFEAEKSRANMRSIQTVSMRIFKQTDYKWFIPLFCVTLIFFSNSCIVDLGIKSRYKKLNDFDKSKVVFLDVSKTNIDEMKNDGNIYAITGKQLLKTIEKLENVMVYKWKPYCSSEFCYPLSFIQKYCDSNELFLFVIVDHYDTQMMFKELDIIKPLFSINEKYYKTSSRKKLSKLFMLDLLKDEKLSNEIFWHTSFVFKNGKLIDSRIKMEDDNAGELKIF